MNKPILITGCPRSGTSVVAGIMFYLGVYLGDMFIKRNKTNPTGFFEDIQWGMADHGLITGEATKEQWETEYKRLIDRYSKMEIPGFIRWGWKAPSAAEIIDDVINTANPDIIWVRRNKEDTLKSMVKNRWMINGEEVFKKTEENMSKVKSHIIEYERLLERPEFEIGRLIEHFKLNQSKLDKALLHVLRPADNTKECEQESYMNYL